MDIRVGQGIRNLSDEHFSLGPDSTEGKTHPITINEVPTVVVHFCRD